MEPLVLFHDPGSRSERVKLLLELTGLPFELRDGGSAARASAAYRARNPFGTVPVLMHGDAVILESAAQMLHIADLAGAFLPDVGSAARGQVYAWVVLCVATTEPVVMHWWGRRDEDSLAAARRVMSHADALLTGPWCVGDTMTVADVLLYWQTSVLTSTPLLDGFQQLVAHRERVHGHLGR